MLLHKFVSKEHHRRFIELINLDKTSMKDNERLALFYVISGNNDLYRNLDKLYDFDDKCVIAEIDNERIYILALQEAFNTTATHILIEFAFNLYNYSFPQKTTYCDLVSLDYDNFSLVINALELRRKGLSFFNISWLKGDSKGIFYSDMDYETLFKNAFGNTDVLSIGDRGQNRLLLKKYKGFINQEDFLGVEESVISYLKSREGEIRDRSGFDDECDFCNQEVFVVCYHLEILNNENEHRQDWINALGDRHVITQEEIRINVCDECGSWQIDHDC